MREYMMNDVYTATERDVDTMYWIPSGLHCRTHFSEAFHPYTAE